MLVDEFWGSLAIGLVFKNFEENYIGSIKAASVASVIMRLI